MNNYMTDEELLQFISDIEENDLVKAPLNIEKKVFDEIDKVKQIAEYKRFRNRVMISVAAVVVITSFIPLWAKLLPNNISRTYYIREKLNSGILNSQEDYENPSNVITSDTEFKEDGLYDEDIIKIGNSHYISDLLNKRED